MGKPTEVQKAAQAKRRTALEQKRSNAAEAPNQVGLVRGPDFTRDELGVVLHCVTTLPLENAAMKVHQGLAQAKLEQIAQGVIQSEQKEPE